MKEDLREGLHGELVVQTTEEMAAPHIAGEGVFVYSTPAMVGHMERASVEAIRDYLDADEFSVGVHVNISHIAATRIGESVRAKSRVSKVERRRITFFVEAYNQKEKIGEGTHQRVVIKKTRLPR